MLFNICSLDWWIEIICNFYETAHLLYFGGHPFSGLEGPKSSLVKKEVHSLLLGVSILASFCGVDCCNFDSAALLQMCGNLLLLLVFMCLDRSEVGWLTLSQSYVCTTIFLTDLQNGTFLTQI